MLRLLSFAPSSLDLLFLSEANITVLICVQCKEDLVQEPPGIRFIVACPRSGSTLLMRVFSEASSCATTSRLVLMGNMGDHGICSNFQPDHTILQNPQEHPVYKSAQALGKHFLVSKEEFGNDRRKGECDYDVFPDTSKYTMVKPAFLLRDPIRTFDSWKSVGWLDVESLICCYKKLFLMLDASDTSYCLLYERLVHNPEIEIDSLCKWWGIPFEANMLTFTRPFGSFFFNNDRERRIYCEENPRGLFTNVRAHQNITPDIPSHNLLTNTEMEYIENQIGKLYLKCWGAKMEELRKALEEKTWFAFDLDDTLHDYRGASRRAAETVFQLIRIGYRTDVDALRAAYGRILKQTTTGAFTDGKTSYEYRHERITALLNEFSIPIAPGLVEDLVILYKSELGKYLELKPGARSLLTALKAMGKKIVIITEGPQDGQEWTLKELKIEDKVDYLATTNFFRTSKVDGLFGKVLEHLNIDAASMVYVGDSKDRDMVPAMKEGIFSILYAEHEWLSLDKTPVRINTLKKLETILKG